MKQTATKKAKKTLTTDERVEQILSKPTLQEKQKEFYKQIANILKA